MNTENEVATRSFWNKTWGRFLRHHGMIAPSGKLIQLLIPFVERGSAVLDLGCGEGRNTIYLTRIGYRATGLDLSFKGVKVLANNLFEEELKAQCLVGDARELPFSSGMFAGVLAHNLFDYLDREGHQKAMAEAFRVLAPKGVLLMTMDAIPEGLTSKQVVIKDDGSCVFLTGPQKGMLMRPYQEGELHEAFNHGWEVLKEELSPRKSKIVLLRKVAHSG